MLQRTTLAPPVSQQDGLGAGQTTPAQMAPWFKHFLIVIALIGVVACVFVWQANTIAGIQIDTANLKGEAAALERANARLMVELAVLDSPANIAQSAAQRGLKGERAPTVQVVPIPTAVEPAGPVRRYDGISDQLTGWLRDLAQRNGLTLQANAE